MPHVHPAGQPAEPRGGRGVEDEQDGIRHRWSALRGGADVRIAHARSSLPFVNEARPRAPVLARGNTGNKSGQE